MKINHKTTIERGGRALLAPALIGVLTVPLLLLDAAPPREGAPVAAWLPAASMQSLAAAIAPVDGRILAAGALPGLWLVTAEGPGLAEALSRAGALLLFDPDRLPGCFDLPPSFRERASS